MSVAFPSAISDLLPAGAHALLPRPPSDRPAAHASRRGVPSAKCPCFWTRATHRRNPRLRTPPPPTIVVGAHPTSKPDLRTVDVSQPPCLRVACPEYEETSCELVTLISGQSLSADPLSYGERARTAAGQRLDPVRRSAAYGPCRAR